MMLTLQTQFAFVQQQQQGKCHSYCMLLVPLSSSLSLSLSLSHPQLTRIHTEPMTSQRVRMMSTLMSWEEGPKNTHTPTREAKLSDT
jgi:hypothetical protein